MHRARVEMTKRHVFRHHIGPPHQFSGDLICWKCTAPFVAVREHTNKGAEVQAQFRLAPKTQHDEDCPLNPTLVTSHIAHGSHGLAEVDDKGILRLNLPENITHVPPTSPGDDEAVPEDVVRHTVNTVRPLLPPAVNSAAKIAQFLQIHDFDKEIVDRFKVRPHTGRVIEWRRFCYGPTAASYAELYRRCLKREVFTHPIAVVGTVRRVNYDRKGRSYITLALTVPTNGAAGGAFHVVVRSEHASLIEPLGEGTHVLAVSAGWEIFDGGRSPELRMWADEHWQLAYWTTTDDDQSTTPYCPPPVTALQRARVQADARSRRTARRPASPVRPTSVQPAQPGPSSQPAAADLGTSAAAPDTGSRQPAPQIPPTPTTGPTPTPRTSVVNGSTGEPAIPPPSTVPPPLPQPPVPAGEPMPDPPQSSQFPPPPPFPPSDPGEGGRRSALRRWLRRVRERP